MINPDVNNAGKSIHYLAIIVQDLKKLGVYHQQSAALEKAVRDTRGCYTSDNRYFLKEQVEVSTIQGQPMTKMRKACCCTITKSCLNGDILRRLYQGTLVIAGCYYNSPQTIFHTQSQDTLQELLRTQAQPRNQAVLKHTDPPLEGNLAMTASDVDNTCTTIDSSCHPENMSSPDDTNLSTEIPKEANASTAPPLQTPADALEETSTLTDTIPASQSKDVHGQKRGMDLRQGPAQQVLPAIWPKKDNKGPQKCS